MISGIAHACIRLFDNDAQGLFEAIAQFGDQTFGTGDYVFDQCDLAAQNFAGSAQNLANNYWTYVCGYPFTDVDQNGDPYSEGFTGRARIGNQGTYMLRSEKKS